MRNVGFYYLSFLYYKYNLKIIKENIWVWFRPNVELNPNIFEVIFFRPNPDLDPFNLCSLEQTKTSY